MFETHKLWCMLCGMWNDFYERLQQKRCISAVLSSLRGSVEKARQSTEEIRKSAESL